MTQKELHKLVMKHSNNCTFLIGNGINRYANIGCSWEELLKALASVYCPSLKLECIPHGLSYTEYFDLLDIYRIKETPNFNSENFSRIVSLCSSKELSPKYFYGLDELLLKKPVNLSLSEIEKNVRANEDVFNNTNLLENCNIAMLLTTLGDKLKPALNNSLAKSICFFMNEWNPVTVHKKITSFAKQKNIPILTTNYDNLFEKSCNASLHKYDNKLANESLPISYCYTTLSTPSFEKFGIWHVNGMIEFPQSLLIGLTHYMRTLESIRSLLLPPNKFNAELFQGNLMRLENIYETWIHLLFSKDIFIFGLSLNSDEVLLRWLLLERSKYYSLFPYVERNAWYILPESEQIELGKQYFLNTVGIKIIRVPTYDAIYKAFSV